MDLSLWTVSNDRPDAKVADLTTMETITAGNGNITYTAPRNTYLLPETTYAVVTSAVVSRKVLEFVGDNGEDDGTLSGWAIGDTFFTRSILFAQRESVSAISTGTKRSRGHRRSGYWQSCTHCPDASGPGEAAVYRRGCPSGPGNLYSAT